jgi:hypothetical protein
LPNAARLATESRRVEPALLRAAKPRRKAALGTPTRETACQMVAAASPPQPFLSSATPHEYTLGAHTGATACGNAATASTFFSFSPSPSYGLLGAAVAMRASLAATAISASLAATAIHASLAATAINASRSHGRHHVRQRSSRVDVLFLLAVATLRCVRHGSSRVAVAAAATYFVAVSFFSRFLSTVFEAGRWPFLIDSAIPEGKPAVTTHHADHKNFVLAQLRFLLNPPPLG